MVRKVEFEVEAKDKSDDVDKSIRRLQEAKKASDDTSFSFGKLNEKALTVAKGIASVGSTLAAVTALSGPAITGLVHVGEGLVAIGHGAVGLTPLVGALPLLAAGFELISGTAKLAGPGIAKALQPVLSQFANTDKATGAITKSVQALASKGVEPLARQFAKVNLPAIHGAMDDIAKSINGIILSVGKWVNSAEGQSTIQSITEAVSIQFRILAPLISQAFIAFARLADRVGADDVFMTLGGYIDNIVRAFTNWANNVTVEDILHSFQMLSDAGSKIKQAFFALKDAGEWMANNQQKVRDFSDAVAVLGVVLGVLSGNYIGATLAGLTLLINHWGDVRKAFESAKLWWDETWVSITTNPSFRAIVGEIQDIGASLRDDLIAAWEALNPPLQETAGYAEKAWTALQPLVVQFFKDPTVIAGLKAIGLGLAAAALAFVTLTGAAVIAAAAIGAALTGLAVYIVGGFAKAIMWAIEWIVRLFGDFEAAAGAAIGAIPGLGNVGKAMQAAGNSAQSAADRIKQMNDRLSGLNSKTITIRSDFIETHSIISTQQAQHVAGGGLIPGAPSTVDTVPLMVAGGEFVINSASTSKYLPLLRAINNDAVPSGTSSSPATAGAPAGGGGGGTVNVYVTNAVVGNEDALSRVVIDAIRRAQGRGYGPAFG